MNDKNVLVLIDVYNEHGGASKVAVNAGRYYKSYFKNVYIVSNNKLTGEVLPEDVLIINSINRFRDFLNKNPIHCIHYFQSECSLRHKRVFSKLINALGTTEKDVRILTTVCQQPSAPISILTSNVISHSDFIVFIDKTAFSDPNYSFISEDRKDWMYLIGSSMESLYDKFVKTDYCHQCKEVVYGRGCTFNKYPKDTIDIYDKIKINSQKKFYAIGVPVSSNWFSKQAEGRVDIIHCPILPVEKYAEICKKMDIFIYYLPEDTHSSIDGSLLIVMRLGVPVIVYGPSAPKELINHGINGYIAETKRDIVKYAELLGNDPALREKIGKAGRQSILELTPVMDWKENHRLILCYLMNNSKPDSIATPIPFQIETFIKRLLYNFVTILKKTIRVLILKVM